MLSEKWKERLDRIPVLAVFLAVLIYGLLIGGACTSGLWYAYGEYMSWEYLSTDEL